MKALKTSDGQERFIAQGVDPTTSTQAQFAALLKSEMERWAKLVKVSGIRAE